MPNSTTADRRQRRRLADLVRFARTRSPYFRRRYRGLPEGVTDPAQLPVTGKAELMEVFDDWVTDPAVTLAVARDFAADPAMIGRPFLGRFALSTSSGTTGTHGIFLQDGSAATARNLIMARMLSRWLTARDVVEIAQQGGRITFIVPEGGHFASTVAASRLRNRRNVQVLSVHRPLDELVEALNAFRPTVISPYASVGALLAGAAEAGRLRIDPVLVILTAEGLPTPEYDRISRALGAKVRTSYAANECPFLTYSCAAGWLHVNTDWAVLEPVDDQHRPVPAGQPSDTVLLTNLANRVQPVLRYDLGDRVVERPDPCPCGQPGQVIKVQGRASDLLTFPDENGASINLAPLPLATLLEAIPGLELFQIVQTAPASLALRLRPAPGADADQLWRTAHDRLTQLLTRHRLGHVTVARAGESPQHSTGGKIRGVVPFPDSVHTDGSARSGG